jgi:hypothetical protein
MGTAPQSSGRNERHGENIMADEKNGTENAEVVLSTTDERIPAAMRPLVESGAIKATLDKVTAEQKGKEEKATREYVRLTALTVEGALALCGGRMVKVTEGDAKGNGVLDYFNYGFDLGVRSNERNALLTSLEGPEKGIERAVKGLMAAGIAREVAIPIVVSQLKAQGTIPADYEYKG